ncbi:hypothetical protein MVEG_04322 [Podila verticillata NRRL 6337]|nr:hypothetical protein MVEG_04322 [Podila verticillata NRRL 6337]
MRSSKAAGKDAEEYEDQFLRQTIGGRIKSNSTKFGSHKLNRHYTASSLTPPSASSSSGVPGSSASAVSSYLENLPSIISVSAPPRPTRPPGGLLGISNGRGMGYGRTLGASYDSPVTTHGSFNGHVRSGANLYGGTQGSGLSPTKSGSSGHHHRPTLSVFPIQKAMEISLKEWRLLQAASNRGEASSLSTGPTSGMAFVRELRRLRHARGVNITEHSDKEENTIVRQFGDDSTEGNMVKMDSYSQGLNGSRTPEAKDISKSFMATARTVHEHGDIRIQRPAIASFDAKMQYPGIAHLPHTLTPQTSTVAVRLSPTKSVYPTGSAVHEVRKLLDSYPAPSPYCVDEKKRSPLHFAAASGDLELVEFLLERGVRPDCGRDIAGNMPLHLAIISNRIDVVAALLKAGADMTLASPMTLKTPLDLAESRLSYLLSRAQEASKPQHPEAIDLFNKQIATRSTPPTQSSALLDQIKGIVGLLRPYVVRQQRLQHGERQKERQKERSWERADKYMRQQSNEGSEGMWRMDGQSEDNYGDMEDEDDDEDGMMDVGSSHRKQPGLDHDGDMELIDELPPYSEKSRKVRRIPRRMNANETEEALESLMNGLSLLEANRLQQQQLGSEGSTSRPQQASGYAGLHRGSSDIGDGNLADTELDRENEVDDGLPDLLEQVQQVLQAIKLNESSPV